MVVGVVIAVLLIVLVLVIVKHFWILLVAWRVLLDRGGVS
jgi:hypothetical protein